LEYNLAAKRLYDETVRQNQEVQERLEDGIYEEHPVIMIHKITPAALSEADILKIQGLNKEERRLKRKELIDGYRLRLMEKYLNKELTLDELKELVK
jgi:hypothetical protein